MATILDNTRNWLYFKYIEEKDRTCDDWAMGRESVESKNA